MAVEPDWTSGTITLTSGSANFTTSTAIPAGFRPGDEVRHPNGKSLIIATITEPARTGGTLVFNAPADCAGTHAIRLRIQSDASRFTAVAVNLIELLRGGILSAFGTLVGAANKLPYFTGPSTFALTDLTVQGRQLLAATDEAGLRAIGNYRERLTGNRIYYVRTDGNDNNTGLANTVGGAFRNISKALAVAAALDLNGFALIIQVGAGTWPSVTLPNVVGGSPVLLGDEASPANVTISSSGIGVLADSIGTTWHIRGFKITTSGAGAAGLFVRNATVFFQNIDWGAVGSGAAQKSAWSGGKIISTGTSIISGGAASHFYAEMGGLILDEGRTIYVNFSPAYTSAFARATAGGLLGVGGNTFVGSATGPRYQVDGNAVIRTYGAGANYLPGNAAAGTPVATGGQYI